MIYFLVKQKSKQTALFVLQGGSMKKFAFGCLSVLVGLALVVVIDVWLYRSIRQAWLATALKGFSCVVCATVVCLIVRCRTSNDLDKAFDRVELYLQGLTKLLVCIHIVAVPFGIALVLGGFLDGTTPTDEIWSLDFSQILKAAGSSAGMLGYLVGAFFAMLMFGDALKKLRISVFGSDGKVEHESFEF
jgi:hypothetical protein